MDLFFSYLDPGTGSVIIQAFIGAMAGIAVFGRRVFMGLGGKFRGIFGRSNKS